MKPTLLFWLFFTIASALPAQKGTLFGTITDSETEEAVPGAKVFLLKSYQGDLADISGNFEISGIKKGTYDVICESEGYLTDTVYGLAIKGKFIEYPFSLKQIPCKPRKDKETFADLVFTAPDSIPLEKAQKGFPISLQFSARVGDKFGVFRTWGIKEKEVLLSLHRTEKMDCEPIPSPEPGYYSEEWSENLRLVERGRYRFNIYSDDYGKTMKMVDIIVF